MQETPDRPRLLILSPVRNEAALLPGTIESVLAQTVRPREWIIIDDGSTDATADIARSAAARHSWIQLVQRPDRGTRKVGGGVIEALYDGLKHCNLDDFDYVCKLDGDLTFGPRYFERLFERFESDPCLGTASGKCWDKTPSGWIPLRTSDDFSLGACKAYRVSCFRDIGGLVRGTMWDGIDCHRCRMKGWKAKSFHDEELRLFEHRPMGSSHKSVYHGRLRWGRGQYFMGTHGLYAVAIAAYRLFERPYILGGLCILAGFFSAWLRREPRYDDPEFRRYLRSWQMQELGRWWERRGYDVSNDDSADFPAPITMLGMPLHPVRFQHALRLLIRLAKGNRAAYAVTANVDHLVRFTRNPDVRDIYRRADLVVADGMPVIWASRFLRTPLPERVAGSDLFPALCEEASKENLSVFLLGGAPGSAEEAARILRDRHPKLRIVGTFCPDFGFEKDPIRSRQVLNIVRDAKPDILFVGLGSPKQENWIVAHREAAGAKLSIGVGISFSFLCGHVRRAPRWMQRIGLEWFHRLVQEPGRLWKRYLIDDTRFLALVLRSRFERGRRSPT